jgi:hypothetical protein
MPAANRYAPLLVDSHFGSHSGNFHIFFDKTHCNECIHADGMYTAEYVLVDLD